MVIFQFSKMAVAAVLGFQNSKFSTVGGFKRVELCRHAKFGRNRRNRCRDMAIFSIFQDGSRHHVGFLNFWNFDGRNAQENRTASCAKFRRNRSKHGQNMAIFRFFDFYKMAVAAILDFQNSKFLAVGRLKRVELHRRAKFDRNRSNCCGYMAIFRFFQDGGRPPS